MARLITITAIVGAALHGQARAGQAIEWTFINFSDCLSTPHSLAALNNAGQVAGSMHSAKAENFDTVFRWSDGEFVSIEFPSMLAVATGMSEGGIVVGTVQPLGPGASIEPFIWWPDERKHDVLEPEAPFFPASINDDLLITGLAQDGLHGVVYDAVRGELTTIALGETPKRPVGTLGAMGINSGGLVTGQEVVFLSELGFFAERPYQWTPGAGATELPIPAGFVGGRGVAVSTNGHIAGTMLDDSFGERPAFWPAGGGAPTVLNPPVNFFIAEGTAVNAQGQIGVVAPNDLFGFTEAFIWSDGAYIDLTAVAPANVPGRVAQITDLNDSSEALVVITSGLFITARGIMRPVESVSPADLNDDGFVNAADLALLLGSWGACGECPADLNDDGDVNAADLALLLGAWT